MCDIVYSHDASTRTASVIPEISYFDICRTNVNNGLQISMTHSVLLNTTDVDKLSESLMSADEFHAGI